MQTTPNTTAGAKENSRNMFLANITHEFRTPIQTILATLDLLNETNLDPEQMEYVQQVHFSADTLLSLVNDFLDFSKLESGKFRFEYIPYDPLFTAEQTVDLLAIEAYNKGIEIITDIDYQLPGQIIGDPARTRQILLNLLKNAVKFTSKGYVQVNIGADEVAHTISFQIKDSGIGIPKEKQALLFTDFYQSDASTTRKYGGTGLGLAISKNFVTAMNGTIKMEDNPTGGSIFTFTLPYKEPEEHNEQHLYSRLLAPSVTEGQKLLIVDDQETAAVSFQKKLRILGFADVQAVCTGEKALEVMQKAAEEGKPFTQVFIDMIMPGMDGWRLSSEINQNQKINSAKLFLLIPEGQMGGDAKMKRLKWFNSYLYKPIKKDSLVDLLKETAGDVLELESATEEPPKSAPPVKPQYERIAENKTILIAEDHPVNQKLIKTFFQQFGAKTICASNGEEAVQEAKAHPELYIIFMDIQMPVKCGIQATEEIRAAGITVPIIACTANTEESDFQSYLDAGMSGILIKPFKKQTVYDLLLEWIQKTDKIADFSAENTAKTIQQTTQTKESLQNKRIWDRDDMLNTASGDVILAKQLVSDFITQTILLLDKIKSAIKQSNFKEIQQHAHTLKGSAAMLSILKLSDCAKQMEIVAKAQSLEACKTCLKECGQSFEEFCKLSENWSSKQ